MAKTKKVRPQLLLLLSLSLWICYQVTWPEKKAPIIIIIIIIILVIIIIIAVVLIINQYLFLYCYIMLCFDVTSSTHYNTIRYSTMSCFKIVATAGLDEPFDALYKYSPPLDFPHETLHDCSPT